MHMATQFTRTALIFLVHVLGIGVGGHSVSHGATLTVLEGSRNLRRSPGDTILHQLQQWCPVSKKFGFELDTSFCASSEDLDVNDYLANKQAAVIALEAVRGSAANILGQESSESGLCAMLADPISASAVPQWCEEGGAAICKSISEVSCCQKPSPQDSPTWCNQDTHGMECNQDLVVVQSLLRDACDRSRHNKLSALKALELMSTKVSKLLILVTSPKFGTEKIYEYLGFGGCLEWLANNMASIDMFTKQDRKSQALMCESQAEDKTLTLGAAAKTALDERSKMIATQIEQKMAQLAKNN